ncbi:GNAT family N-acetyltransferase [Streptomyces sp. NPDC006879]|uniref:GNAT family N-acetyltransferase n=1 Tax=Streptomyces sp. NPDC006879 TaxID=3364767 RepID=UPI0036A32FC9
MLNGFEIRTTPYDHPDAVKLNDQVQLEYVQRYEGDGDATPLDPAMFAPPNGTYLLVYDAAGVPVASGGWRAMDHNPLGHTDGDAELKRMYVVPEARGLGLARLLLTELEASARDAGRIRMALETGDKQPEAIALYRSAGYTPCAKFGHYRDYDSSRCYAKTLGAERG